MGKAVKSGKSKSRTPVAARSTGLRPAYLRALDRISTARTSRPPAQAARADRAYAKKRAAFVRTLNKARIERRTPSPVKRPARPPTPAAQPARESVIPLPPRPVHSPAYTPTGRESPYSPTSPTSTGSFPTPDTSNLPSRPSNPVGSTIGLLSSAAARLEAELPAEESKFETPNNPLPDLSSPPSLRRAANRPLYLAGWRQFIPREPETPDSPDPYRFDV